MGYHKKDIPKGEYGEFSKIKEEFLEAEDAFEQGNKIMMLVELSDLMGAMRLHLEKHYNMSLEDLYTMSEATRRAFEDGTREKRK